MTSVEDVNAMALDDFVAAFGDVAEHSPWVAARAWANRPFADREALIGAFSHALSDAAPEAKLALIRAHPDLATRARLTADSTSEQVGAGLDRLSPAEFARFTRLNEAYRKRFGFPFVFAVRGATQGDILRAFAERSGNSPQTEFETALFHIMRIFRFRLEDRVSP